MPLATPIPVSASATAPNVIDTQGVLAVIPARLAATRLPRKPLRLLGGLPLIVRVYQRVASLAVAQSIVVATDHEEVAHACGEYAIPVALTSREHPSGTDRIAELARRDEFARFSVFLNVQGDEPFISREAVLGAVNIVVSGTAPIGTAAMSADRGVLAQPDVVKVVSTDAGFALYFSRAAIPFLRNNSDALALAGAVRQHIGVYAYSRQALLSWVAWPPHPLELIERLEQLRPLAHGLQIGVAQVAAMGSAPGGIDTEEDLKAANAYWDSIPGAQITPAHQHSL